MELEATTLWDFPIQSYGKTPKGDNKFKGVTPALAIWNLIQRYTKLGDLVVDPMCGSGTSIDVCKEEGRRVIGFDIAPYRNDIIQADARKIPLKKDSVDFLFIDSPYSDNIKYSNHPDCIGKISCEEEEFFNELEKVAKEVNRILKPCKVVAWLIADSYRKRKFVPVGFKLYQILCKYFEPIDIVILASRNHESFTLEWQNKARERNFFLRGFKYLFIMKKISTQNMLT